MKYDKLSNKKKSFQGFISDLRKRLNSPLPGEKAHLKMASDIRLRELKSIYDKSGAISGSVLILLYPENNSVYTILILRQEYDGVHSGQVSFPGGRKEKSDKSLTETALRESKEEVGLNPANVTVIGNLTEMYIPPSNFLVKPVVAFMSEKPELVADKSEVAEIIKVDLLSLFDIKNIKKKVIKIRGHKIKTQYFDVHGHVVWGATAMIISELLEVVKNTNDN